MNQKKYAEKLAARQESKIDPAKDIENITFIDWLDTVLGSGSMVITYIDTYGDRELGQLTTLHCKPREIEDRGAMVRFDPDELMPCLCVEALDGSSTVCINIYDIVKLEVIIA